MSPSEVRELKPSFERHYALCRIAQRIESALAASSPARFAEITESARNRFVVLLSDDRVLRILANSRSIDPTTVMDGRELLFLDLSALPATSARFLSALITTMFVTAALQRRPHFSAPFRLAIDEGENVITSQIARLLDQCAKFRLYLTPVAIQRLGQLRKRGPEVMDAIFTNCTTTVCFGIGNDPEAATFMAESLLAPFDLEKWKQSSMRPTAVGSEEVIAHSRSVSRSAFSCERLSAERTEASSISSSKGFSRKSAAPTFMASTASGTSPCPVMTMTGI